MTAFALVLALVPISLSAEPAVPGKAAASIKGMPSVAITSANDPTKPVPGGVRWFGRDHQKCLAKTAAADFDLCFLGDSITQGWPGDLFGKHYGKYRPANFGIGGDRAENVLWRLQNGELVGTSPKVIVLLLGTNNSGMNEPGEIALGVATVVQTLRTMLPKTKILLLGIFPRSDPNRAKTDAANPFLAKMDDGEMVRYLDIGGAFLDGDKIKAGVLRDVVHLSRSGYEIWAKAMDPLLTELMGK